MSTKKKIRIEYYQVVKNDKDSRGMDELFCLEKLIAVACKKTIVDRTYQYYDEEARLDKIRYNKLDDYWYLNFVRLRQTKIPVKARRTEEAKPIELESDEYIGEDVTAVYDCKNNILALQKNRDSLGATGIEIYLNNLYNNSQYNIFLRPVAGDVEQKINKIHSVRRMELRFADNLYGTKKGLEKSSFADLLKYFTDLESNSAVVTVSLGNKWRNRSLCMEKIKQTIADIRNTNGIVSDAQLSVTYADDGPTDIIDLFSMRQYDFIDIKIEKLKSIEFGYISEEICKAYNKNKERILYGLKE